FFVYIFIMCIFLINIREETSDKNSDSVKTNMSLFFTEVRSESVLKSYVDEINRKQEIFNEYLFGPFEADNTIIAIQVHDRSDYLKLTIDSLEKVKGIEKTLLIFSHDIFDPEINEIVRGIKFAKVMQIFYPYSTQLFPNTFPGDDPNDCPRNTRKSDAIRMKCNSAEFPDKYGHYRESKFTQMKHHWFWKLNFIFDRLKISINFEGYVVLLEDDYYLIPDSLYVFEEMRKLIMDDSNCVYSLGIREYKMDPVKTDVIVQFKGIPFSSHIFNKKFWITFKKYSEKFCTYDDCNYDYSFVGFSLGFLKPQPFSIYPLVPRLYHIGNQGVHENTTTRFGTYNQVKTDLLKIKQHLFPNQLRVEYKNELSPVQEYGGFNDPRDKKLCMSFTV
ncbi:alpha-1:6-mannosyl-glycoprotein 2-beta-N-acetylglucosaminyltransferase-like isoform X3, partial [Leptotrombidium deliense]